MNHNILKKFLLDNLGWELSIASIKENYEMYLSIYSLFTSDGTPPMLSYHIKKSEIHFDNTDFLINFEYGFDLSNVHKVDPLYFGSYFKSVPHLLKNGDIVTYHEKDDEKIQECLNLFMEVLTTVPEDILSLLSSVQEYNETLDGKIQEFRHYLSYAPTLVEMPLF